MKTCSEGARPLEFLSYVLTTVGGKPMPRRKSDSYAQQYRNYSDTMDFLI